MRWFPLHFRLFRVGICGSGSSFVTVGSESVSDFYGSVFHGVSAAALNRMLRRAAGEVPAGELAGQGVHSRKKIAVGAVSSSSIALIVVHGDSGYDLLETLQIAGFRCEPLVSHMPPFPDLSENCFDFCLGVILLVYACFFGVLFAFAFWNHVRFVWLYP